MFGCGMIMWYYLKPDGNCGKPGLFLPVVILNIECHDYVVYFGEEYRSEDGFHLAVVCQA